MLSNVNVKFQHVLIIIYYTANALSYKIPLLEKHVQLIFHVKYSLIYFYKNSTFAVNDKTIRCYFDSSIKSHKYEIFCATTLSRLESH